MWDLDSPLLVSMFILTFLKDASTLRMLGVVIPQYTLRGEMAMLQCRYELGEDRLYSVTWYKDHEEFFRYDPARTPPQRYHRVEGFKLEHHLSDSQKVFLRNVNLRARGIYRCEVSAEAPSFTSVHGEGRMDVISLPIEGPVIAGEDRIYNAGDIVSLNCTTGKSYPPAKIKWYVNDIQMGSEYEAILQQPPHGLLTSVAGLRFRAASDHFSLPPAVTTSSGDGGSEDVGKRRMRVRCVATISLISHNNINNNNGRVNMQISSPGDAQPHALHQQRAVKAPFLDTREAQIFLEGGSSSQNAMSLLTLLTICYIVRRLTCDIS